MGSEIVLGVLGAGGESKGGGGVEECSGCGSDWDAAWGWKRSLMLFGARSIGCCEEVAVVGLGLMVVATENLEEDDAIEGLCFKFLPLSPGPAPPSAPTSVPGSAEVDDESTLKLEEFD